MGSRRGGPAPERPRGMKAAAAAADTSTEQRHHLDLITSPGLLLPHVAGVKMRKGGGAGRQAPQKWLGSLRFLRSPRMASWLSDGWKAEALVGTRVAAEWPTPGWAWAA